MKHTHETYSCDRCKADLGAEPPKRNQGAVVKAAFHWRDGPGPAFEWNDLCDRCDTAVKAFFHIDLGQGSGSEKRSAREALSTVLTWKNEDAADHLLVRVWRMLGGQDLLEVGRPKP